MCGIFGYISAIFPTTDNELLNSINTLSHRGPDAVGIKLFEGGHVGFGHRRLSILDLSESANQPMMSGDGRYCLIYNGEFYNYKEVREDLSLNHGVQFKTNGDSEVLLEGFSVWGVDLISRVNGMFAFAIYDSQEKEVWMFRDRMGIKPIFYQILDDSSLVFGSELKSLTNFRVFNKDLDYESISNFLHLGYIPAPRTVWRDVKKFAQGSYLRMKLGDKPSFFSYWSLQDKLTPNVEVDESNAKSELSKLIESAVELRLVSDVPVGTFLSGGIDSSLVTAFASKLKPDPILTFTIGFRESKYDESKYARKVAEYLKTDHTEYILSESEAQSMLLDIVEVYDEPFADSSAIPTMLVSKLARAKVKVILTGDGGDEQFLGYGSYHWAKRLSQPGVFHSRFIISQLLRLGGMRYKRAAEVFQVPQRSNFHDHIFSQEQYFFSDPELTQLTKRKASTHFDFPILSRQLNAADSQAFFDLKYYLPDDLLVKVDRASMRYGLECRVPLLDYRIVEYSVNLSQSLKWRAGTSKYLLKSILYDMIPKSYFERSKWGFAIPLDKWLLSDFGYLIDNLCISSPIYDHGIVERSEVLKVVGRYKNGASYLYNRIWALIVLHLWAQKNL